MRRPRGRATFSLGVGGAMDSPAPHQGKGLLTVNATSAKGVVWIVVGGEVDLANRDQLRAPASPRSSSVEHAWSTWTYACSPSATATVVGPWSASRSGREQPGAWSGSTGPGRSCARSWASSTTRTRLGLPHFRCRCRNSRATALGLRPLPSRVSPVVGREPHDETPDCQVVTASAFRRRRTCWVRWRRC